MLRKYPTPTISSDYAPTPPINKNATYQCRIYLSMEKDPRVHACAPQRQQIGIRACRAKIFANSNSSVAGAVAYSLHPQTQQRVWLCCEYMPMFCETFTCRLYFSPTHCQIHTKCVPCIRSARSGVMVYIPNVDEMFHRLSVSLCVSEADRKTDRERENEI